MITVSDLPPHELVFSAIRASGPGGQNVNKVSSAVWLKFDVHASSLPEAVKQRLIKLPDQRIGKNGIVNIKAQNFRSQERNRQDALERLDKLLARAQRVRKPRKATRPSRASVKRRLDDKRKQGERKRMRREIDY